MFSWWYSRLPVGKSLISCAVLAPCCLMHSKALSTILMLYSIAGIPFLLFHSIPLTCWGEPGKQSEFNVTRACQLC